MCETNATSASEELMRSTALEWKVKNAFQPWPWCASGTHWDISACPGTSLFKLISWWKVVSFWFLEGSFLNSAQSITCTCFCLSHEILNKLIWIIQLNNHTPTQSLLSCRETRKREKRTGKFCPTFQSGRSEQPAAWHEASPTELTTDFLWLKLLNCPSPNVSSVPVRISFTAGLGGPHYEFEVGNRANPQV